MTRTGGGAMHVANRHVERWAPESSASRVRSMRSLGFVDRLVSPWLETAQRSMGLRMFSSPSYTRTNERERNHVSWVFPRPWYQDELDWMAAAREVSSETSGSDVQPSMLTTRGTYVAPQATRRPQATVMPSALYEYVAPSLSIAQPAPAMPRGAEGETFAPAQAYSPLVSLAAVQAAELMNRAVAPLVSAPTQTQPATPAQMGRITPALRTVLTTMLERASVQTTPAQVSMRAPEMVTPPAPRAEDEQPVRAPAEAPTPAMTVADQVATDLHVQRTQMAQLHAIAQREQAATRAAEVQAIAQRTEAEVRQRTAVAPAPAVAPAAATLPAITPPAPTTAIEAERAERARLEERVLQRVAERVAAQRLHESARAEAAQHARSLDERREPPVAAPAPVQPPAEILAAIAALPPQLAGVLSENVMQQPGGAMRAITQVNEALRTAELIARSAATNTAFEPTRGPRLVMPAGLGGLVATVDRAHGPTMAPTAPSVAPTATDAAPARERAYRVPTLPWIAPSTPTAIGASSIATPVTRMAPTSALGAATTAAPQGLAHVAWADRWLARFAGASPRSLETLQAASSSSMATMAHLASIAPQAVFLANLFDSERAPTAAVPRGETIATAGSATAPSATAPSPVRTPTLIPPAPPPILRFDDSAETPDDVFAAISASASRSRKAPAPAAQPTVATAAVAPSATPAPRADRITYADHVAHAAPSAPHAGLAAQLASSPFAPALRHVLALPSAPSFDVRSLFGGSLSATYLAGLLAPASHELEVASPMPAWTSWSPSIGAPAAIGERAVPSFDAAYVAPDATATPAIPTETATDTAIAPSLAPSVAPAAAAPLAGHAPLTTLRSALLSWTGDVGATGAIATTTPTMASTSVETTASHAMAAPSPARSILESLTMPMVGETEPSSIGGWTSPGAIADRAYGYSLAHERSTADLSFDFVPPELVLAARVYGLGPAEAAQAARLALAGPGQLTAMANTVDRTFVHAMAINAERRDGARAITTAFPSETGEVTTALAPAARAAAAATLSTMATPAEPPSLIGSASHTSFGVDRRAPRGAFLWPSAAVAALGLTASSPDGDQSMSVAALELLAAQAVAEIGTYAALDHAPSAEATDAASEPSARSSAPAMTMLAPDATNAPTTARPTATAPTTAIEASEPGEADILGAASTMITPARRARFDALYVALSQAPAGKSLSPAARAARALALAGRGDDAPPSARERAATVWDVLPVVYATEGMSTEEAVQTQAELGANTPRGIAARASLRRPGLGFSDELVVPDARPGLSSLASRAGEALGGYVTSVSASSVPVGSTSVSSSSSSSSSSTPIAQRAPSAAQEMVQTGRPAGRHGGGETEIPPWFEAAARKMLGERMGTETISMAELTLVNSAPSTQIAAASRTGHVSAAPTSPSAGGADSGEAKKGDDADVDAIAEEVYTKIMIMMDAARSRNGEPYL